MLYLLLQKIQLAEYTLKEINKSLKKHPFGRDKEVYSFVMQDSGDQEDDDPDHHDELRMLDDGIRQLVIGHAVRRWLPYLSFLKARACASVISDPRHR